MTTPESRQDDRPQDPRPQLDPLGDELELVAVERTVTIQADVDQVWRSLRHLDDLVDWLGVERDATAGEVDPGPVPVVPGLAARLVEPDGSARHLLVTEVTDGARVGWHWWHDDGVLSTVEITLEPVSAEPGAATVVHVVETLALDGAGSSGLSRVQLCATLEDGWATRTERLAGGLAERLAGRLGVLAVAR